MLLLRRVVLLFLMASLSTALVAHTGTRAKAAKRTTAATPATVPFEADPQITRALKDVSALRIQATIQKLVSFGTRLTVSTNLPVSSGRGVLAAANWIQQQFDAYSKDCGGCLEVKTYKFTQDPGPRVPQPTEITDVYAVLRGTNPISATRMYVITGHYDSIAMAKMTDPATDAPGANDDGSGTAVVLEAARVLSKLKFPATILFVAVAGEEQGLDGSRGFAKMAQAQGWNIEADLNNDIVGGDKSPGQDPHVVRVFSEGLPISIVNESSLVKEIRLVGLESDSPSRQIARYVNAVGQAYAGADVAQPYLVFRQDRYLRGGDHTAFNEYTFPAVRFTEWRENYNHQHQVVRTENGIEYGDLPKFVDFDYVARVARLNIATLASLASAPAPPQQVRIDATKLENGTTLNWLPSPGGLATSYEVLWRRTTAATWENARDVENQTTAAIDESKDNVIFAVRSVDKAGHRSVAVVPTREGRH